MPNPVPTDEQIVEVRRVAALTSREEAAALVARLNDAEWASAVSLIGKWGEVADEFAVVTGKVRVDPEVRRRALRDEMRTLLGLPEYGAASAGVGIISAPVRPVW